MERKCIMEINKDMTIGELVRDFPEVIPVLFSYHLGCIGCPSAQAETLEEACIVHGIDLQSMLEDLRVAVEEANN